MKNGKPELVTSRGQTGETVLRCECGGEAAVPRDSDSVVLEHAEQCDMGAKAAHYLIGARCVTVEHTRGRGAA